MSGNTYERMLQACVGMSLDRAIRECSHIANEMCNEQLATVAALTAENAEIRNNGSKWYAGQLMDAWAKRDRAEADNALLQAALRYITRPTMALPSGVDPIAFASEGAREADVRLALVTCIRMAQSALDAAATQ